VSEWVTGGGGRWEVRGRISEVVARCPHVPGQVCNGEAVAVKRYIMVQLESAEAV